MYFFFNLQESTLSISLTLDDQQQLTTSPRNVLNEDRHVHIAALQDSKHNSVCPVKLLVILALRTGAVDATSWEELKTQTLRRQDRTVQWKIPK